MWWQSAPREMICIKIQDSKNALKTNLTDIIKIQLFQVRFFQWLCVYKVIIIIIIISSNPDMGCHIFFNVLQLSQRRIGEVINKWKNKIMHNVRTLKLKPQFLQILIFGPFWLQRVPVKSKASPILRNYISQWVVACYVLMGRCNIRLVL